MDRNRDKCNIQGPEVRFRQRQTWWWRRSCSQKEAAQQAAGGPSPIGSFVSRLLPLRSFRWSEPSPPDVWLGTQPPDSGRAVTLIKP